MINTLVEDSGHGWEPTSHRKSKHTLGLAQQGYMHNSAMSQSIIPHPIEHGPRLWSASKLTARLDKDLIKLPKYLTINLNP